jgi:hypothetical protein
VGGTVQRSNAAMARYPNQAIVTWIPMITAATAIFAGTFGASGSMTPSLPSSAMTRSRMIQVLTAHQPTARAAWIAAGR